jgi:hypothetical protein
MFRKTKERDFIENKKAKLEFLQNKSSSALDLVTNTINNLSDINEEIDKTIFEIEEAKTKLESTENDLKQQQGKNSKIITKFRALIEED